MELLSHSSVAPERRSAYSLSYSVCGAGRKLLLKNFCYVCHQSRVSRLIKDAMHHQLQATFRNSNVPASAAWEFFCFGWCWRKLAKASFLKTLPFALMAALNVAIFIAATRSTWRFRHEIRGDYLDYRADIARSRFLHSNQRQRNDS